MASPGADSGYEDGGLAHDRGASLRGADGYDDADGFDNSGDYGGAASYGGGMRNYTNYANPDAYGDDDYGEDDRMSYAPAAAGGRGRY